jgi:single-stranded DNA-binding protein
MEPTTSDVIAALFVTALAGMNFYLIMKLDYLRHGPPRYRSTMMRFLSRHRRREPSTIGRRITATPDFNRVILSGKPVQTPVLQLAADDNQVCSFSLVVTYRHEDAGGPQQEVTAIECEARGDMAKVIHANVRKGQTILVEGRLGLEQRHGDGDPRRSTLKMVVEHFDFIELCPDDEETEKQGESPLPAPC